MSFEGHIVVQVSAHRFSTSSCNIIKISVPVHLKHVSDHHTALWKLRGVSGETTGYECFVFCIFYTLQHSVKLF